jgi:hypothetical protein
MRRATIAIVLPIIMSGCSDPETTYRANIGKTAFNATNGVEIGRIEGVAQVNGAWVYRVNREARLINSPVDNVVVKDTPSTVAKEPAPVAPAAQIDPAVESTATEFRRRLAQYGGTLSSMTMAGGTIAAAWTSSKCDYLEGEVIDLLLSVNRTQKASPAIRGSRTCGGKDNTFSLDGATFERYRTAKISDPDVLKAIR